MKEGVDIAKRTDEHEKVRLCMGETDPGKQPKEDKDLDFYMSSLQRFRSVFFFSPASTTYFVILLILDVLSYVFILIKSTFIKIMVLLATLE